MSVALHAIAIAVMVGHHGADPVVVRPPVPPAPAEPPPVEITLWTEPTAVPALGPADLAPAAPATSPGAAKALHAPRVAASIAPRAAEPEVRAGPTRSLAMRSDPDLRISELPPATAAARMEKAPETAEKTAPLTRPASPDSGEPDPHQTHEAFSMNVDGDGTAHLHDRPNLRWALGMPTKKTARDRLDAWQDELAHAYDTHDYCADPERPIEHPIGSVGATILVFDVTDWAMRSHGDDPYASAKLAQLDATRGERMQAGARYRERELGNAGSLMAHNLDQLWATVPDLAERKRQLFALWDECSETGTEADIAAGVRARARVIAFIRAHLPAGSAGAFTSAELAALNRDKQSHEQFAPYAE